MKREIRKYINKSDIMCGLHIGRYPFVDGSGEAAIGVNGTRDVAALRNDALARADAEVVLAERGRLVYHACTAQALVSDAITKKARAAENIVRSERERERESTRYPS
jgi:hypothetical protein